MSNKHNRNGNGDIVMPTSRGSNDKKKGARWRDRHFVGLGVTMLGIVSLLALTLGISMVGNARSAQEKLIQEQSVNQHQQQNIPTDNNPNTHHNPYQHQYDYSNGTMTGNDHFTTEYANQDYATYYPITTYTTEDASKHPEQFGNKRLASSKPQKATLIYPNH